MKALIGYSGFVGNTLMRQTNFDALYRSTNIEDIENKEFDLVICAGAPAQKWIANRNPSEDRAKIEKLISHLSKVKCASFILISTVDVFVTPSEVTEHSPVPEHELGAYGLHRRLLEKFVAAQFSNHLVVRLPGLVGPGLRKNAIFDRLNDNNLDAIDSRSVFQFYPMVNLWHDLKLAQVAQLRLVHLTAAPLQVADAFEQGFGTPFDHVGSGEPVRYDMRTVHADLFGGAGDYQYSARESIQAIRAYAQSEPKTLHTKDAA